MSRCWGCCQENCNYGTACGCDCHERAVAGYEDGPNRSSYTIGVMSRVHTEDFTGRLLCPCKKHRRYQAKRKPRSTCEACWRYYVKVNPDVES